MNICFQPRPRTTEVPLRESQVLHSAMQPRPQPERLGADYRPRHRLQRAQPQGGRYLCQI